MPAECQPHETHRMRVSSCDFGTEAASARAPSETSAHSRTARLGAVEGVGPEPGGGAGGGALPPRP